MHALASKRSGVSFGRWFGVQVRADWSLLLIFVVIVIQLGAAAWPRAHPEWSEALQWAMAVCAAVLFFLTVLLHELAHALVARRFGVDVQEVLLFLFGGMAMMRSRPRKPSHELAIAAAGPLASIAIGAAALAALGAGVDPNITDPERALAALTPGQTLLAWLGPINLVLAAFNLVPGFPLDGGRLLRAVLWSVTGDLYKATAWAAGTGRVIAMLIMATGLTMAFGVYVPALGRGLGPGLWLLLIGWFLYAAARASLVQVIARDELSGVRVEALMRSQLRTVDPSDTLQEIVERDVMGTEQDAFPVVRDGRFLGMITLRDIQRVPADRKSTTTAADVMHDAGELEPLGAGQDAVSALQRLTEGGEGELPVEREGRFAGLLKASDVLRFLSLRREELGAR